MRSCVVLAAVFSAAVSYAAPKNFDIINEYLSDGEAHYQLVCKADDQEITLKYGATDVEVLENEQCSGVSKKKGQSFVDYINEICDCVVQ